MTREEYKDKHGWWIGNVENEIIDEIYDDFESRTCENCKHNDGMDVIDNAIDRNILRTEPYCDYMANMFDCGYINKDFGCNKFERKIDGDV